jgi:8-amino-7-oxononanoate synthase
MNRVEQYLAGRLQERTLAGNLRRLSVGKAPVDFFSNDYLGFATTGALAAHLEREASTGSTGSRLLSGNSAEAEQLECTIAAFHHAEAALLFNSGYDANVGLLSAIASRSTTILYDELCHASIIDGVRLSQCNHKYKFAHNDLQSLEQKLLKYAGEGPVIIVAESVYSMDGDMAPLEMLVQLAGQYNAQLVVDEAHATGVFGAHGEGRVCAAGLHDKVFARIHTFGKALGCHGAAVAGSEVLKQYLINFARPFIYSTALPGHSVAAIQCAYQQLAPASFTNQPLHDLIDYFRHCIKESSAGEWKDSISPIQAFVAGDNERCKWLAARLQAGGLQVNAILHPTVPLGLERLRVCLHSFNTSEEVDKLFALLKG